MANEKLVTRETAKKVVKGFQEKLENGQIIPSKALITQEIETISPESGDIQETPFINQGTGTANGTSSVDTGTVGKHIQKQGSVYCVNQLVENGNFADVTGWSGIRTTSTVSSNTLTAICNSNSSTAWGIVTSSLNHSSSLLASHKYLITFDFYHNIDLSKISSFDFTINYARTFTAPKDIWTRIAKIIQPSSDYAFGYQTVVRFNNTSDIQVGVDFIQFKNYQVIDLTQWFNGNIPQDLLDNPSHWSWYQTYGDYIPYNTGTLVSGNGRYLVCGGRNIWDEETELGRYDVNGDDYATNDYIRTKNPIRVIPNATYYIYVGSNVGVNLRFYDINGNSLGSSYNQQKMNTTFVVPTNAYYMRFYPLADYGNTYKHDITISLYYAGEDYSQYYPYEQPKVYDTGTETLLSTGVKLSVSGEREDVYDYKEPNGLITHNVKKMTITSSIGNPGTSYTNIVYYYVSVPTDGKKTSDKKAVSSWFGEALEGSGFDQAKYIGCMLSNASNGQWWFGFAPGTTLEQAQAKLDNMEIIYELATPTTEQGTPFNENIEINDFGTMGWYATYTDTNTNALVSVPQGCEIFYPAWYVGFVDTLGQRADIDWNANNVVSKTELASAIAFKELASSNIGAITSSQVVAGEFYKNNIAITGGLTNAKYVIAHMSNGNKYPMIITNSLLVTYSGTSWQASNLTVTKIYYKE